MTTRRRTSQSTAGKTPVLFRMVKPTDVDRQLQAPRAVPWPADIVGASWLIALFPTIPGTGDPRTCSSYVHVGQHGSADLHGLMRGSRPAKPGEYRALAAELRRIGYKLVIVQRVTAAMNRARLGSLR